VKAEGDTFSLLPNSPNREYYKNLLHLIAQQAGAAAGGLEGSQYCYGLAEVDLLSRPRQRPYSPMQ
jgi:hypothetical protein